MKCGLRTGEEIAPMSTDFEDIDWMCSNCNKSYVYFEIGWTGKNVPVIGEIKEE